MTDIPRSDAGSGLVLVVEDDPAIRSYIAAILQSADIKVLEAADGVEALDVFRHWRGQITLVITDIRMPRMTGIDLAHSLRLDSPALPLIFVSGEPAPTDKTISCREFLFVEKPFAPKALLDAARKFIR